MGLAQKGLALWPAATDQWDLAVRQPLRWGIAGCGKLAEDFAGVLSMVPGATLAAVAEEYDVVWRALSNGTTANGTPPHDGVSSVERAQVRPLSSGLMQPEVTPSV